MPLLFASIALLFTGPLLDRAGRRRPLVLAAVDGFVLIAVAGLVFAEILPEAYGHAGPWALVTALVGLFGPRLLERSQGFINRGGHALTFTIAVLGLLGHAAIDGVALADAEESAGHGMGLAVILHRIAVSVSIWVIAVREKGNWAGYCALFAMGLFTVLGFSLGHSWLAAPDSRLLGAFEGLVAGSLLHVLLHAETRELASQRVAAALGAVIGSLLLVGLSLMDGHGHDVEGAGETEASVHFAEAFLGLALEVAPALALALGIVFLLQVFFPFQPWGWFARGGALSQVLKGLVVGIPLPLCSCGVVPVYRQMARRGVPAAAGLTFLVATPEIGVDALLVSLPLLGFEFTAWRVGAALVTAIAAGLLVTRGATEKVEAASIDSSAGPRLELGARLKRAWEEGVLGLFSATVPWIILGIAIAAVLQGLEITSVLERVPGPLRVLAFALAGIPLYVCASGATPMVAALIAQGVSPGAALAFLLTGPATNATTFGVLSDLHGRRLAIRFGMVVFAATVGVGYLLDAVAGPLDFPSIEGHVHDGGGAVAWSCLGFLTALFLLVLLQLGPRALLGMILPWAARGHDHAHHHDHGHDAGDCCGHS